MCEGEGDDELHVTGTGEMYHTRELYGNKGNVIHRGAPVLHLARLFRKGSGARRS